MLIVALPLDSAAADEANPPPESVTEPVGVTFPVVPLTVIVTVRACAVVVLVADGVTVTVGVVTGGVSIDTMT
jgi:hypothetical protein